MKKNVLITLFIATLMISSVAGINYIGNTLTYFSSANLAIGKSTATERLDVSGNIAVSGTVDGRDIASDGSTLDTLESTVNTLDGILGSITSGEADQIENIGATTISNTQWGYLGLLNQGLSTSNNVIFNTITASPSSAVTGLTIDQNYNAKGLYIDSEATTASNYGLHVETGQGATGSRMSYGPSTFIDLVRNPNDAATGTNVFYRNLASADTNNPLVAIIQDNAGDDQPALIVQQDGTASAIKIGAGSNVHIEFLGSGSCVAGVYGLYTSAGDIYWCKDGVGTKLN